MNHEQIKKAALGAAGAGLIAAMTLSSFAAQNVNKNGGWDHTGIVAEAEFNTPEVEKKVPQAEADQNVKPEKAPQAETDQKVKPEKTPQTETEQQNRQKGQKHNQNNDQNNVQNDHQQESQVKPEHREQAQGSQNPDGNSGFGHRRSDTRDASRHMGVPDDAKKNHERNSRISPKPDAGSASNGRQHQPERKSSNGQQHQQEGNTSNGRQHQPEKSITNQHQQKLSTV